MLEIYRLNPVSDGVDSSRKLDTGLIRPSSKPIEEVQNELAEDHTSEPIRNPEDIDRISSYLISNNRWRDNMLFIIGINFGLRVSDLRMLRFCNLIDEDLTFKTTFPVLELKTKNTRKVKHNRYITINDAVIQAVTLYLKHTPGVALDDYLFRSQSPNGCYLNEPIHRNSVDRILKGIEKDMGLGIHMSTHTLRKTFGYHQMLMSDNDPRKLLLLSKMFGHSSTVITMQYIGITDDEIEDAYNKLNLGYRTRYLDSKIYEDKCAV